MGAREFIAMRDFIRRWHINHEAKYPTPYQKYYLTTEESNAVAEALADSVLNLLNS
jgi:Uri superfamily endonuclease